jgi:hypothetical protein
VYHDRLLAQAIQDDVFEGDGAFQPPDGLAGLVAAVGMPPAGDEATRWSEYEGSYGMPTWGVLDPMAPADHFLVAGGNPTFETNETGTPVRHTLVEIQPGLFLADNGETLDFRSPQPTWRNVKLERLSDGPSAASSVLLAASAGVAIAWIVLGLVSAIRHRRPAEAGPDGQGARRWSRLETVIATVAAILVLVACALIAAIPRLVDVGFLGWLELPFAIRLALHLPLALAIVAASLVALAAVAWARGWWSPTRGRRLVALMVATTAVAFQFGAWDLVGWGFA